jgi:hypothetical protein
VCRSFIQTVYKCLMLPSTRQAQSRRGPAKASQCTGCCTCCPWQAGGDCPPDPHCSAHAHCASARISMPASRYASQVKRSWGGL